MFVSDITQDYCDCYLSALALKALVAKCKNLWPNLLIVVKDPMKSWVEFSFQNKKTNKTKIKP